MFLNFRQQWKWDHQTTLLGDLISFLVIQFKIIVGEYVQC